MLDPIEPVAPRIVTLRGAAAAFGLARELCFIKSPNEQSPGSAIKAPPKHTHHDGGQHGCQKSIEPVHQGIS